MFGQPTVSSSECTTHWRLNSIKHTHTVVTTIIFRAKFSRFFLHHSQRSGLLLRSCAPSLYSATFSRAVIQLGRFEIIAQQRSPRAQNVFIFYFHFRRHRHLFDSSILFRPFIPPLLLLAILISNPAFPILHFYSSFSLSLILCLFLSLGFFFHGLSEACLSSYSLFLIYF
ncbi:unnamed protein product [Acanthosepion pharaonis]|uniref:Uncharacterized protein n=1 Tax=Acanthosepion pharaonis TaxID=158019 RepID=A0A812AW10_ACAPH|nr:unnamed protein product [Sepia pharaonis]